MASVIKGYEYDVFISYRQKNNNCDGWVTQFVSNLRKELEAISKEEISVYFDLNQYDGIHSSYDVDKSLQSKLNSLIFIPILSHTYCDTNSYAWQYELCTFNKLAEHDSFGKMIKLRNGNVVSRILPVKIHHLDNADLQLFQKETGSLPRSIDFIYEETGVNRPLMNEDHKGDNLNKTDYRNQINKLANVIKDMLTSMHGENLISSTVEVCKTCRVNDENISLKSIAVLPFTNLSRDPDMEYFGESIAEELINSLVHLQDLKVAGHMSSLQFKDRNNDLREVGAKLGVCHVLVGSVLIHGSRLRVTAQLISMEDGFNIWSEKFDRNLEDIFAIHDEIAQAITEMLKISLFETDNKNLRRNYIPKREAYDYFLKGKFYTNKRGTHVLTGVDFFKKGIEADPNFALAHAGLADANSLLASYGLIPPMKVKDTIKQAAEKAIQLDPTICEPYCSLGFYYTCIERNFPKGKQYFLKSLELNPSYAQGHYWYGWNYLAWIEGNFSEAEKHGEIAINLEPLSAICYAIYSRILHARGKYKEALVISQKGLELEPNSYLCQINEGNAYFSLNDFEKAAESFEMAIKISHRHNFALNGLLWTQTKLGNIDKARSLMTELIQKSKAEYISYAFTAISAAYLNDLDFAFECLERAYDEHDPVIVSIGNENWFPSILVQDQRFHSMIDKIYKTPQERLEVTG
jgi:TolB-like protein/Tfp pilus assembly protein PilF